MGERSLLLAVVPPLIQKNAEELSRTVNQHFGMEHPFDWSAILTAEPKFWPVLVLNQLDRFDLPISDELRELMFSLVKADQLGAFLTI